MRCFTVLAATGLFNACGVPAADPPPPPPRPAQAAPPALAPPGNAAPALGLQFDVEPATAAPGATVTLVLRNASPHRVGYNLCMSGLEQRQRDGWRPLPSTGVCTRELRSLAPGQEARYPRPLPTSLPSGEYRFRTQVETPLNSSPQNPIFSEPFYVRR